MKGKYTDIPRVEQADKLNAEGERENLLSYCFRAKIKDRVKALNLAQATGNYKEHKALANNDLEAGLILFEVEVEALEDIHSLDIVGNSSLDAAEISVTTAIPSKASLT